MKNRWFWMCLKDYGFPKDTVEVFCLIFPPIFTKKMDVLIFQKSSEAFSRNTPSSFGNCCKNKKAWKWLWWLNTTGVFCNWMVNSPIWRLRLDFKPEISHRYRKRRHYLKSFRYIFRKPSFWDSTISFQGLFPSKSWKSKCRWMGIKALISWRGGVALGRFGGYA